MEAFKDQKYNQTGRLGDVADLEEAGNEMKEGAGDLGGISLTKPSRMGNSLQKLWGGQKIESKEKWLKLPPI